MTEYIKSLREIAGTRPLIQCGATVVVFGEANRVLMLRMRAPVQLCYDETLDPVQAMTRVNGMRKVRDM
ncbi:hypothetical protein [Alicyclobacillus ferrooxydans]|uniref:Uncharacterized protein n=1 Tax=Alicyclobacillus ferrooxydans TaxID=471514 RepID=A0A0N8PMQ3_9BACL|nr:hypothetical protein [Alicyclobacillus ferrooxydans]KPV39365.1 hypothetical protein AN477_23045 [Alicyclobacillus ferrooxydans]